MRLHRRLFFGALLLAGLSAQALHPIYSQQAAATPWPVWSAENAAALGDDNSGSTFASGEVDGAAVIEVTPGGASDETKLSWPVSGADLQAWAAASALELDSYLPADNALNPTAFFLGVGDVTGAWAWVDGTFGAASGESGWVTVTYPLDGFAGRLQADRMYEIYLSFFNDANGDKPALTEPFYLGEMRLVSGAATPQASAPSSDPPSRAIADLLSLDDEALMDAVARASFDYFWNEANPANGLVRDRSTSTSPASIAAVGFGLAALPIGVERGWITADEGYQRALTTLETFTGGGVQGEHGFFYHFVDMNTGARVWDSELSSIDTALLVAGALVAGQYFDGTDVQTLANQLYEAVEWDWMTNGGRFVRMGWTPESGFLGAAWDHFDESQILYTLAIGSPTHPVPASVWAEWDRPIKVTGERIYLPGEPLFVYQYPQAFLNLRGLEDHFANYWNNTVRACEWAREFAADAADVFTTYQGGVWGISASDGPTGYRAYGASDVNHDGTIAPYASVSCLPFTREASLDGMRAMLRQFGDRVWGEYGFVSAVNADANWYSRDHIGIDVGDSLLMLANAQDGLVWNLFMSHPAIQTALDAMGFVPGSGDYAVTPEYFAERVGP